jgi:hypothetical protein
MELRGLPNGEALRIPRPRLKGISVADFRSAISRGAILLNLEIATYSDSFSVYVWIRTPKTKTYERHR